jgi:glycosyltransferase involved in cell wall biosynthesis
MTTRPLRVLLIASHPVQYASPIFRLLAKDPRVEIQVAYCGLGGAEAHVDPEFGVEIKWDVPLLDGYPWITLPNRWPFGRNTPFFRLFNPGVWSLIRKGKFDAVVLYTGYVCATFWIALLAAKLSGAAVLFGTDAHELTPLDGKKWKLWFKKLFWPWLFRLPDVAVILSSGGVALMRTLGIPEERIALAPFCVDNEWWLKRSTNVERDTVRARWGIPVEAAVIVYCAKFQPWKRPQDVLRAFARTDVSTAYLVLVGEGPLRSAMEQEAESLGIKERVRFLGFVNQSSLPEVYTASDLLVLTSQYEAFGLVVNEAMLCRCPAVVSDHVGARFDLVREGETGYVYPCGDESALAERIQTALSDIPRLQRMGEAARSRMMSWSPNEYVESLIISISRTHESRAHR